MNINPRPAGKPSRAARALKFSGRSAVVLALLALGNPYVPVIDGVTAATQITYLPPLLTLLTNGAKLGTNSTVTVTEGQNIVITAQGGDTYGYPVQVQLNAGLPAGAQTNPAVSYAYGINPVLYVSWTPPIGAAASIPSSQLTFLTYNYYSRLSATNTVTIKVAKWSPSAANINCLFNWAERTFPGLLAPTGFATAVSGVYSFRYYAATGSYLGVSSVDNHVYLLGADGQLHDEGLMTTWMPQAGC